MNFQKMTIKARLRSGLGLIIAFMVVLTITGIWSLSQINGKLEKIINTDNAKIVLAQDVERAVSAIEKGVLSIIIVNEETNTVDKKKKIENARAAYESVIGKLEKMETTAKGKEYIQTIKENYTIAQVANDKVLGYVFAGNANLATTTMSGVFEVSNLLGESCAELVKYQTERTKVSGQEARNTYTRARIVLLSLGIAVFVFALFLASFLAKSITKPLNEGVFAAQRIAEGDLTVHLESTSTDETGQLLGALENMTGKLQSIIGDVKSAAGNIASASKALNERSELMSKGAGEQAGRASQVATASEEMSQTVLDIAKNTSSIEGSAIDTAKLAKDGEEVVAKSVDKVKAIAKTIDESAQLIRSLGDRSHQIGEIVNVINDIADQTNLLALNAAIEAARAGDAGRGFAVVADEVKKLAERTGNSTSEIGGMVKSIQDEVGQVVVSMGNITKEVKSGVDLSTQAGGVLHSIVASVDQLHVMVQQIASATEEMASTSEEINKDIESIASVSKEASANSEHIAEASQRLAGLSVDLEGIVEGFKV